MLYVALDTEETGLFHPHGAKPFIVSISDSKERSKVWEFEVNPKTREPKVPLSSLEEIANRIEGNSLVCHNLPYDVRGCAAVGLYIKFPQKIWPHECLPIYWRRPEQKKIVEVQCADFEETVIASHVCYSDEEHALKPLAFKYLDVPDFDQQELKSAVTAARREGKKRGWSLGVNPKGEAEPGYDYWMPKAVDKKSKLASIYALRDVKDRTLPLWLLFQAIMNDDVTGGLWKSYREEKDLLPIIYAMEATGIPIDPKRVRKLSQRMRRQQLRYFRTCKSIAKEITGRDDFNPNSPQQLSELLYGFSVRQKGGTPTIQKAGTRQTFALPVVKATPSGGASTDSAVMDALLKATFKMSHNRKRLSCNELISPSHPLWRMRQACKYVVAHLRASKFDTGDGYLNSYDKLSLPSREYPGFNNLWFSWNQAGTRLTRLSSSNPNGQNITENSVIPLKSVFAPPPGYVWYELDYKQLELVILAYAAKDKKMIAAFEAGADFHTFVSEELGIERVDAKRINFRITYGGDGDFIDSVGGPGTYDRLASRFPRLVPYMNDMIAFVRQHGYVHTLSGRRLYVEEHRAKTKSVNAVVQGTAGEIIKFAMRRIQHDGILDWTHNRILLQIHDSLLIQLKKSKTNRTTISEIAQHMVDAGAEVGVKTPVDVKKVRSHWADKEVFEL